MTNVIITNAEVKKIIGSSEKHELVNIEFNNETPNGKIAKGWVNVVSFNPIGLAVGDKIDINGQLNTNKYVKDDGSTRYDLRVVANSINRK